MDAYFKELTRRLSAAGIQTAPPEKDRLPILWNGKAVFSVSPSAEIWTRSEDVPGDAAEELYYKAAGIAREVREYVTAVEQAPPLRATGLDGSFHRLAEFNDVVFAGRELPSGHGYQFVTWGWNESDNSLYHGHYFEDSYTQAKEDFAARSGLVQRDKLLSAEQLTEVFRAAEQALESRRLLTERRRELLEQLCGQIRECVPDLQERVMRYDEEERAALAGYRGESQGADGVEIYWQDLTPAKQAELLRAFGDNGNWDVVPIVTLETPDQTEFQGMGIGGM